MVEFTWIYLAIFLIIPLSRIIPRLLAKRRHSQIQERQVPSEFGFSSSSQDLPKTQAPKPKSKEMQVLAELNFGARTFESIQKNTGLEAEDLDSVLQGLERDGLMEVHQKQGLFGPKIELHLTQKGEKKFYS